MAPPGKNQPGQFGGVAQQRLQKLRHHHQAAEEKNSQGEHHHVRAQEIEVLEEANVDDRGLAEPLPDNQRDQAHSRHDRQGEDEV